MSPFHSIPATHDILATNATHAIYTTHAIHTTYASYVIHAQWFLHYFYFRTHTKCMAKKKKQTTPEPVWIKHAWWVVPLIALAVYIPNFSAGFTLDDVLIVEENTYIRSLDKIPDIWTSHYWAGKLDASDDGLYRPLTLTTYNLQYVLFGAAPAGFHVLNILLHALVCLVLMKFVQLVFRDPVLMAISGLLFALHPVHTEAVAGIVGRAEILAALFILLSAIAYHHWRKSGSWRWYGILLISCFAAITSKEHGFLIPAILMLQELYYFSTWKNFSWGEKSKWIAFAGVILVSVVLWSYRATVTGPPVPHELWADIDASTRMATATRTTAEYVWLHVLPIKLTADYWTGNVPIVDWGDWKVLVSFLAMAGFAMLAFVFRKRHPVAAWGILFFFLTLLPVSNFLFAAGFIKAERILYIPSIGLIIALAYAILLLKSYPVGQRAWFGVLGIMVLLFGIRTWMRTYDWKDNYTLSLATLKTTPDSPRFNNMMGLELRAQKKGSEALAFFEKSIQYNPTHVPALVNLGTEYRNQGRLPEAAATLEKALAIDPSTMATYVNLMAVYRSLEDYDKNLMIAKKAMERYPQSAAVVWNAANAYQLRGDMTTADQLRVKARAIDPNIGAGK